MNSDFGFGKVVDVSFDDAIEKVTAELEKEGFGVLSDIDVAAKMKAKLVLVREDASDKVHVDFMDPESVLSLVKDPGVAPLASDVKHRLQRVLAAL
jgi:hypothetical protein